MAHRPNVSTARFHLDARIVPAILVHEGVSLNVLTHNASESNQDGLTFVILYSQIVSLSLTPASTNRATLTISPTANTADLVYTERTVSL